MKKTLLFFGIIFLGLVSFSQDCNHPTSSVELEINNVRAMYLNGGDMFWDQPGTGDARYEIPKGGGNHSLFAGALWFGGVDSSSGEVLVTAQTYRQSHYSYWPGPVETPNTDANKCDFWDRHFEIKSSEIKSFIDGYNAGYLQSPNHINPKILNWPAKGNPHIDTISGSATIDLNKDLAPFEDVNNDGIYNPMDGDYPKIRGSQSVWWVMNDVGNIKEFGSLPVSVDDRIGLEVQVEAFSFATNDELNDVTFQHYKLINKGNKTLSNSYVGIWVDVDLGWYRDDYVGCDSTRSLGYAYNGDDYDGLMEGDTIYIPSTTPISEGQIIVGPIDGYNESPASIGIQFCKGIKADLNDGIDNNFDGSIDEANEEFKMSNFTYYQNNADPLNGNPYNKIVFYNYLRSVWVNGDLVMKDDSLGLNQSVNNPTNFMFNGNPITGTGWTEENANITPGDRRFLMSMGPFTFAPGEVQEFTVAIPWAQSTDGAKAALQKMFDVADKVQQVCDVDFDGYTSIREKVVKQNLGKVFPTEIDDVINVELKNKGIHSFEIINSLGAIVHQENLMKSSQINLSNLDSGIYFYRISGSNGVQSGKIIKK